MELQKDTAPPVSLLRASGQNPAAPEFAFRLDKLRMQIAQQVQQGVTSCAE